MKCAGCSLESERADLFRIVNRFWGRQASVCPACFEEEELKTDKLVVWSFFIIGIVGVPLTLWRPTHAIGIILVIFSIAQLGALISTILHELGHIIAGLMAGFRVFGVEIGKGRIVYEFFFGGLLWRIRTLPFGGCAYGAPRSADLYRIRNLIFVLGGPLVNAILLCVAISLLRFDDQLNSTPFDGTMPFLLFALVNAALLLYSLWPHGQPPNDALLMWRIFRMKDAKIAENLPWRYIFEAERCRQKKDLQRARAWARVGLRQFPENNALKMMAASYLYLQKRYAQAARAFALLAGRDKLSNRINAYILNNVAYCYILLEKPTLLPKADTCSRLALKQDPRVPAYRGTRGCVLVELGNYEEGLKLLHDAMKQHSENYGQALNACYIGIAEARRGALAESRNYFAVARKLDPECILLNRERVV